MSRRRRKWLPSGGTTRGSSIARNSWRGKARPISPGCSGFSRACTACRPSAASRVIAILRKRWRRTVRVDPRTKPAAIDFEHTDGDLKGKAWKGIYVVDGDTLTICDNAPNLE